MDTLTKDTLILLAMELNYAEIIKFCSTSKKVNKYVCENNDFWRNRLYKEYPFTRNLDTKNSRKLFQEIGNEIKDVNTLTEEDANTSGFNIPVYVRPELIEFLLQADLGVIGKNQIPLNYFLRPELSKGILRASMVTSLLERYIRKYKFLENGKFKYRVGDDMNKYLGKYLKQIEDHDIAINKPVPFNRNNFNFNRISSVAAKFVLPRNELTPSQIQELKTVPLDNLQKLIRENNLY